eukprot:884897-Rhodomonas_salina.1
MSSRCTSHKRGGVAARRKWSAGGCGSSVGRRKWAKRTGPASTTTGSSTSSTQMMHPDTVLNSRPSDGACQQQASTSSFAAMSELADAVGGAERIQGSATAVQYQGGFLGVFHVLSLASAGTYVTMAYRFQARAPSPSRRLSRAPVTRLGVR